MKREQIELWAGIVESLIRSESLRFVDRVLVVRETGSTQDVARQMCAGKPGLLVLAGRQTSGRGRLGRGWADTSHMGLAATFTVDTKNQTPARLAVAAGVAACLAVIAMLGEKGPSIGLRWPNDVVERTDDRKGRKIAGILIEQARGLAFIGIGINISQKVSDWPEDLRTRAVSLGQLGPEVQRIDAASRLIPEFDRALAHTDDQLEESWSRHETLLGAKRTFEHNAVRYTGTISGISPLRGVHLRTENGQDHHLPALTTSLLHE